MHARTLIEKEMDGTLRTHLSSVVRSLVACGKEARWASNATMENKVKIDHNWKRTSFILLRVVVFDNYPLSNFVDNRVLSLFVFDVS